MMQPQKKPINDHIGYLDSVRGIAALMVLVYHYIGWKYHDEMSVRIANIFVSGDDAVSFFFVLSGFVLSYKYLVLDHSLDLRHFFIARVFRLLPGFFVAVLSIAFLWNWPLDLHKMKELFILNSQEIYQELFLFRNRTRFYGAGWTLGVELLVSMMVPFMVLIAKRDKRMMVAFAGCLLLIGNGLLSRFHVHFALGVILATFYYDIISDDFNKSRWHRYRWFIIPVGVLLFVFTPIQKISPLGPTLMDLLNYLQIDFYLFSGVGAFILLGALINSPKAQRFFDIGLWRFYGRISYGIYLIHWFVVSLIYDHWDDVLSVMPNVKVAFFVMFIVCIAASTLLALAIHYVVELPFMRYGKRLTKKLKPSTLIVK
jgi:peptidoglycan/LPS O-acetylase OafA/YrhL